MNPEDLLRWQKRLRLTGKAAAELFGIPYATYVGMMPKGRRHRDGLPGWVPVMCARIERERLAGEALALALDALAPPMPGLGISESWADADRATTAIERRNDAARAVRAALAAFEPQAPAEAQGEALS